MSVRQGEWDVCARRILLTIHRIFYIILIIMAADARFEGGREVLKPVEEAKDIYEAIGLWWAKSILEIHTDNGEHRLEGAELVKTSLAVSAFLNLEFIVPKIGGFAKALESVAREAGPMAFIKSDYGPDEHLARAAELADMPCDRLSTFPIHGSTIIKYEGMDAVLIAQLEGDPEQVWPPAP
jgi:hypothetical protein